MNTLRQYYFLFSIILFCTSTPHVWAQQLSENTPKAVQYTYKVIARVTAKQNCIFDGRKVTHFDDANLVDFIFTDNGTIIFWAYTDEGHTLCKNSQALAYNGKSMSGSILINEVNDNVGSVGNAHEPQIFAYNASGDVIYGVWTKTGNSEYYAVALNNALVVNPQAHSEISGQIILSMNGHDLNPRFTKDGKYAVPVIVKDVSDTNKNSPGKSKWLVGGTLQDAAPDPDRSTTNTLRLDHPVGIYADELFKRFLGSNPVIPHADIFEYQYIIPKCRCNHKGQIAMLLSGNGSQVILVATPSSAPGPELEVARIRTDANRDGTITFDDADKSTPAHPYTFWLNNNRDVLMDDEKEDEDQNPALAKLVDSSLPKIPNARDLEDFERLQIKLPADFSADSGKWEVTLELAPLRVC